MEAAVDANVFIHGRGDFDFDEVYTIPKILEELESDTGRNVLENIDYNVEKPSGDSLNEVRELARQINSPTSGADEKLVALALENGYKVVSDDRAVQNLCLHLDVKFEAFLDDEISEKVEWERICDVCGSDFSGKCSRCGSSSSRLRQVRCNSG